MPLRPLRSLICAAFGVAASAAAHAGDIYRWTDDTGRTQLSDSVPERYRKSAERIDTSRFQVPEAERLAAVARAEREKEELERARSEALRAEAQRRAAAAGRNAAVPPTTPFAADRPADTAGMDCASAREAYRASQECFAPFQRGYGRGVREEALSFCQPVADPSPRCGAPRN